MGDRRSSGRPTIISVSYLSVLQFDAHPYVAGMSLEFQRVRLPGIRHYSTRRCARTRRDEEQQVPLRVGH